MSDIILHHYDLSPFSEKIRLALGYKGLEWASVKVDAVPPRPLLDALTGGYRRVPVLQVGADIYCDTEIIFRALERIKPQPSLYPTGEGISKALSFWWDRSTWKPAIGILVDYIGEHLPPEFLADRKNHYLGYDISKQAMAPMLPAYIQEMCAFAEWIDSMLSENGDYLTGKALAVADLTCYHSLWLLRANCGAEAIDKQLFLSKNVINWMDRIAAIGHGHPTEMTPEQALERARTASPSLPSIGFKDPTAIAAGTRVSVTPNDNARVPVTGTLVAADAQEIIIRKDTPETGVLHIHFPRAGFETLPVTASAQSAA